jgi:hypothetical protein
MIIAKISPLGNLILVTWNKPLISVHHFFLEIMRFSYQEGRVDHEIMRFSYQEGRVDHEIPLTGLIPPHFCAWNWISNIL